MNDFKLICFDIDGTLANNSWLLLTEEMGCSTEKHIDIFNSAREGNISFSEAERMLTKMYQESGNATKKFIQEIFSKAKMKPETKKVISYLKNKDYIVYLISGAIDIYVKGIAKKLEVHGFYTNSSLEFGKNGILKKIHYRSNQGEIKLKQLEELTEKLGISINEVVFVGDSENDIEVFRETRHGIAINCSSRKLKEIAWHEIFSLNQIKDIL